ncbi:hypothetical protein [Streptomyces cucumeris]|uniref:hypothetical protein n=1 Tax=Streptomyces cucumeris TaxID=2962890 RepID=UPI0020C8C72F|nr:hypothetical protein [Streptomyces sp. NEAU-Y11]MCP9205485.1 hypothetical protein [Streptomyces sp. NEAU-Y11]
MPRPKTGETPKRNVRVPADVWTAAKDRAKNDGTNISTVVVSALRQYAADGTIPLSDALTTRLIAHADARANAQRNQPPSAPQVQLRTFIAPEQDMVMLDATEVSRLLRDLGTSYQAPELARLADTLDEQAQQALRD